MSVPLSRLPPLDLIRGFVAVGRRMSITLAAEDLHVTQSAVSRQVRTLEDLLGTRLLTRGHRSIAFTPEGDRLFRSVNGALQQVQEAVGAVRVAGARQPVTITSTNTFAGLWLLPRLRDFQLAHPDIDIQIAASEKLEDLRGDGIDLAVRLSSRANAPDGAERLFGETVVPVSNPSLGAEWLGSPDSIENQVLLEFEGANFPWLQWREWLACQGWAKAKPKGILRFNQYTQVILAAIAGQGIALGRTKLLEPMLSDGRLTALGPPNAGPPTDYAHWLITARAKPRDDVLTTARWISSQASPVPAKTTG